jgi:hypothetical protein
VPEAIPAESKAAVLRRAASRRPIELEVSGSSMQGTIPSGAKVVVAGSKAPRRGEIWAFVLPDGVVVVHRFRRAGDGVLWFQGDANDRVDQPVSASLLVGRVTAIDAEGERRTLGLMAYFRDRMALEIRSIRRRLRRVH